MGPLAVADLGKFVDLASAIAWPLAVVLAILLLRQPLAGALSRTTKISAFNVSLELAAVPEFQTRRGSVGPFSLREPAAAQEGPSGLGNLFDQLADPSAAECVVVDLGSGRQWLTSRVFLFAVLLQRMRGLQCVVFVETASESRRRFVGLATPEHIRWSFADRYPWLEAAFARAYETTIWPVASPEAPRLVSPPNGALTATAAGDVALSYLGLVQAHSGVNPPPPAEPLPEPEGWVRIDGQFIEHATWLTGRRMEAILGAVLDREWVDQQAHVAAEDQIVAILAQQGRFVAMCESSGRFCRLIDRAAVVQDVARRA